MELLDCVTDRSIQGQDEVIQHGGVHSDHLDETGQAVSMLFAEVNLFPACPDKFALLCTTARMVTRYWISG